MAVLEDFIEQRTRAELAKAPIGPPVRPTVRAALERVKALLTAAVGHKERFNAEYDGALKAEMERVRATKPSHLKLSKQDLQAEAALNLRATHSAAQQRQAIQRLADEINAAMTQATAEDTAVKTQARRVKVPLLPPAIETDPKRQLYGYDPKVLEAKAEAREQTRLLHTMNARAARVAGQQLVRDTPLAALGVLVDQVPAIEATDPFLADVLDQEIHRVLQVPFAAPAAVNPTTWALEEKDMRAALETHLMGVRQRRLTPEETAAEAADTRELTELTKTVKHVAGRAGTLWSDQHAVMPFA